MVLCQREHVLVAGGTSGRQKKVSVRLLGVSRNSEGSVPVSVLCSLSCCWGKGGGGQQPVMGAADVAFSTKAASGADCASCL